MTKIEYPEGAIRTVEEFRRLVRDKKHEIIYFAGSIIIKELLSEAEPMRLVDSINYLRGRAIEFEFSERGSCWWTYPEDFYFLESETFGVSAGVFFAFINYFHAFAYTLKYRRLFEKPE